MIAMNPPVLNPPVTWAAVVVPLSRPAAPAMAKAMAFAEVAVPSEEQTVLGVECALPEGFRPY